MSRRHSPCTFLATAATSAKLARHTRTRQQSRNLGVGHKAHPAIVSGVWGVVTRRHISRPKLGPWPTLFAATVQSPRSQTSHRAVFASAVPRRPGPQTARRCRRHCGAHIRSRDQTPGVGCEGQRVHGRVPRAGNLRTTGQNGSTAPRGPRGHYSLLRLGL